MSRISRRLTMPCTIRYQAPGPPDVHNNPADSWTEIETTCYIQQRGRQELTEGQISDTTWLVTFSPQTPPPRAADELVVDGLTYQFRGDSWLAYSLQGSADHVEATASRAV